LGLDALFYVLGTDVFEPAWTQAGLFLSGDAELTTRDADDLASCERCRVAYRIPNETIDAFRSRWSIPR
jgi:hypothetical protein